FSVGARHAGIVLALAIIAPLLASNLETAGTRAETAATTVILEGRIPIQKKIPVALGIRDEFDAAQSGRIPDLPAPFQPPRPRARAPVRTAAARQWATPWWPRSSRRPRGASGRRPSGRRSSPPSP